MLKPFTLRGTHTQPASTVSALLLNGIPEVRNKPHGAEVTIIPCISAEAKKRNQTDQWRLMTAAKVGGDDKEIVVVNFKADAEQIYKLYQYVYFEELAKKSFEGLVSGDAAVEAMAAMPDLSASRHGQPQLSTTDKIFMPPSLIGKGIFQDSAEEVFGFYEQNWRLGLDKADRRASETRKQNTYYDEVMQTFYDAECDVIYPAFFQAQHCVAVHEAGEGRRGVDAWEIIASEPHQLRGFTAIRSQEAAHLAQAILEDAFIADRVADDKRLQFARQFNSLHYDKVFGQESSLVEGLNKAQIMDNLFRFGGLS